MVKNSKVEKQELPKISLDPNTDEDVTSIICEISQIYNRQTLVLDLSIVDRF